MEIIRWWGKGRNAQGEVSKAGGKLGVVLIGGIFIEWAHIAGHNCAIWVPHDETVLADWQPHHPIHFPPQGVINDHLELVREGQNEQGVRRAFLKPAPCARQLSWLIQVPTGYSGLRPTPVSLCPTRWCHRSILQQNNFATRGSLQRPSEPHLLRAPPRCPQVPAPSPPQDPAPAPAPPAGSPAHVLRGLAERTDADVEVSAVREVLLEAAEPRQRIAQENLGGGVRGWGWGSMKVWVGPRHPPRSPPHPFPGPAPCMPRPPHRRPRP